MTVLIVAEHRRGELRDVSLEAITAGRSLAEAMDRSLHVAVIAGDVAGHAERLSRAGVETVHTFPNGEEFNHDVSVHALATLAADIDPEVILIPHTVNGLDYAPAVATRLDRPLVTDAIGLEGGDPLRFERGLYGSKLIATVEVDSPAVVTLRPGEWPPAEGTVDVDVQEHSLSIDDAAIRTTVTGFQETATGDVDIADADVLVSVGRGIGEEDNLELIHDLAAALDATVSASRPIIDSGWLPKGRQVGQSGKTVAPDVYLAIGISGAVQHVAGMKNADTIIAINTDPNAPIFDITDVGIVGDLFEVVPALLEAVD